MTGHLVTKSSPINCNAMFPTQEPLTQLQGNILSVLLSNRLQIRVGVNHPNYVYLFTGFYCQVTLLVNGMTLC